MLLTMLIVWGIVNIVLLCLWAGIVGFARRGVDEGRRALRADLAFTVLALVFVMAGTSLANPSVRQVVGSVIQTTTGGFDTPRTPQQVGNGLRATPRRIGPSGRTRGPATNGSSQGPSGVPVPGTSSTDREGEPGASAGGAPPTAANPPPPAPPSDPGPVPSPPPSVSPSPTPSCGDGGSDPCPSPSDSPSPDAAGGA